jgi:hypothetical protein
LLQQNCLYVLDKHQYARRSIFLKQVHPMSAFGT